jgi:molybdenum cofactor biosynthesis enzyme MoaA
MHCPRLDHFAKILPHDHKKNQTVVINCCVMTNAPRFNSYDEMMSSRWLSTTKKLFASNQWPNECVRCKDQEEIGLKSDRLQWIDFHKDLLIDHGSDYLTVSMMLDNICNTACQFCSPYVSSKLASLQTVPSPIRQSVFSPYVGSKLASLQTIRQVGSYEEKLPLHRITQIDLEGGEPSNSKNVKQLLTNLPQRVNTIKMYTNARSFLDELVPVAERGIKIQISISLDGVGAVQEYIRWPTQWSEFCETIEQYKELQIRFPETVNLSFKTTICALNLVDLPNIINFAGKQNINHSVSQLEYPQVLHISSTNSYTVSARNQLEKSPNEFCQKLAHGVATQKENQQEIDKFINQQDMLRKISIKDYIVN